MNKKESKDSTVVSREPIQEVLKNFCESVDSQYGKRNSPATLKWTDIHMLSTALLSVRGIKIQKHEEKCFINYVMDYIELVMYFISSYESTELRKQIKSLQTLLDFISVFFNETDIANTFIRNVTMKVFDLFLHCSFSNISKKGLLSVYNRIAGKSSKEVRVNTAEKEMFYMYKLLDSLCTFGDYAIQADVLETVFRLYGAFFLNKKIKYDLLPGCNELSKALLTEISINTFDADVRTWLNKFNQDSKLLFSIPIQSLMFGNFSCKCPDEGEGRRWLDFNIIEPMVTFFTEDEDIDNWNRIFILPSHVQKVEIKRKFSMDECTTTIFMEMSKPCLSYSMTAQKYMDNMDRNVKIIISNDEKEKITKLISHVLPRLFGASFVGSSCKRQSNEGSSSTLNVFKYSNSNCEKMDQHFAVEPSKTTSSLCQLLLNESKTSSGKHSKATVLNKNVLVESLSCVITEYSACSSRDSINSNVFSIDSNTYKTPSMADDSEMLTDYGKQYPSVSLKDQILQLKRACGYSPSANEQLMSEDVFYSITDGTTEEYETAVELSEPMKAMKMSHFKVMDLVDSSKPNETEKRSQNVSETIRQMSNPQQAHSNKWSLSVLDNQKSAKLASQNDSPKTDNPPIIDCLLESAQDSELTQDLFEAAVGEENVSTPQGIDGNNSDSDSDIFQRTTQVFRPAERHSPEPFTALSMKVNIGIPERQVSEQIIQSQLVKATLMRNNTTVIENGVEMVFIDLTSDDNDELVMDELVLAKAEKSIHPKLNWASDFGHNLPKNPSRLISETKLASVQEDSVINPEKFSKHKKIARNPAESQAFELLQEMDCRTSSETVLVQKPEFNNEDINIVPKPEMSSTSDFVKNVVEQDNSKPKIQRVAKVKNTKSKTNERKIALKEKADSGIPDSTKEPQCHVLLDQDPKEDIVKPRVEELEEQKSTITKSSREIALEDNLVISAVADVGIQESVLPADKPTPTSDDVKEQTVSQAMSEKKVTLEDSTDNANLALRDTKTNQDSNSQVSANSVQNRTSVLKQVMDGAIPKASLEDLDEKENQMDKNINTGTEAIVRENEVDHDLSPQIPSTAPTLQEKHMSLESNKEKRAINVSEPKSKDRSAQGITSKASNKLHTTKLNPKAELIKEDQIISMEVLPKKIKKAKPKANSTKKKIKTIQRFPQPDFDMAQEPDGIKNKDTKAENLAITVEESKPKRARKTKSRNTSEPAKPPKCNNNNYLQMDNIEGITAAQKTDSKMDEANELKIEKPKKHSGISERATESESFPKAEIQAIEPVATTCNGLDITESKNCVETKSEDKAKEKTKKNAKLINILNVQTFKLPLQFKNTCAINADTVDSQKAPEVENLLAEPIMEISAKEPLQSNAITGVNDNFPTSVVSNSSIVKAMVHMNANGEKEAAIISSTPIEKPIHNCETSKIPLVDSDRKPKTVECPPKRTLFKLDSYSYLDQLDLDASSSGDLFTPLSHKQNFTKTYVKKTIQKNTVKQNTRPKSNKPLFGLEPIKHKGFHALFNESRRKHLQAAYTYANQSTCQNLDIAARCEANYSSPDKRDIYLLNKSEASTPEFSTSPSDHYDWPEIDVEDAKGKKINIIQNIALKRKSPKNCITQPQKRMRLDDEILPTFNEIIPSPPKELQNAEGSVHAKDHMMSSMLHHHPFSMDNIFRGFGSSRSGMHGMMPSFGMPMMPSFGRMLNGSMGALGSPMPGNCNFSSSSTVISMTSGPDGRPQVYKETSSTKVAPGGIKETQRTVTDSVSGTKKMEIGHHIGDRAHIIEKEQNLHTGDREEREDFINLDEEQAEDFNKEWTTKTRRRSGLPRISSGVVRNRPAIGHGCCSIPPLTATYSSSSPYHVSGQGKLRKSRNLKSVSGPSNDKSA
ncbi:hypothetical protein HUJ05_010837 [Dendroctonus ponderosae]|nr:hypothetical protein HUJ05_010837 [Dendroctonus ponderosae]